MALIIKTTGVQDYLAGGSEGTFVKALIMGPPSAGKTRSASFWPKPIFADCEKGRMSIADRNMPYGEVVSSKDMEDLLAMLAAECRKPLADRRWLTFVVDTLDAYQRIVMQERLDAEKKEAFSGWGDWGYLDAKMNQFIARFQALPMNIVINLHTKDATIGDDDSKLIVTGPKLKGDLRDQIAAEFDFVGYMGTYYEAIDGQRVLVRGIQWWPDPTRPILKDRSGQLPKFTSVDFTDEDYTRLFIPLANRLDALSESTTLETLGEAQVPAAAPVAPAAGGPVAPKAAAPKVAPKAALVAPVPAAVPTSVASEAATNRNVPPAASVPPAAAASPDPEPETSGATPAPEPEAAPAPEAETPVSEEQAVANVTAGLGGEVVSETPAADEASTEAVTETSVEVEAVSEPDVTHVCGTSVHEGEEGQPGQVTGCGKALNDPTESADLLEIATLKTRTHLCNACFSAWRAATKKEAANA